MSMMIVRLVEDRHSRDEALHIWSEINFDIESAIGQKQWAAKTDLAAAADHYNNFVKLFAGSEFV